MYLIRECERAMRSIRPSNKVGIQQQPGCAEVSSYSRHWPCLFPQHGRGRKHMRTIELTSWQRAIVVRNLGHFARGLFHSDGYRGINRVRAHCADGDHWYEYPRYLFTNESKDILRLCGETLDQLAVAGGSRGGTLFRWHAGRRWRGWMSSSGLSTDGSGCFWRGIGDQNGGDVVGAAGVDGEAHHVIRGAERIGQGPGHGEPG
jgi:hypothetical protein